MEPMDEQLPARPRILNAALSLFSEYGYAGASTTAIAELAEVAQPTLHYHFGSKRELFLEALKMADARFAEGLAPTPETDALPPLERLAATLRSFGYMAIAQPELPRMIFNHASNPDFEKEIGTMLRAGNAEFKAMYEALTTAGVIRDINHAALIEAVVGVFGEAAAFQGMLSSAHDTDFRDETVQREFVDAIVEIFINGIKA